MFCATFIFQTRSKAFKKINKKVVIRVLKKQRKAYKTLLRKKGLSKANKFKAL